ncbi:MAG: GAF domain-containing sensor histidine kinase [Tissierellales bacterium]|nr:GAF domain-containing sensor histidine kinase [Tissierellales bacterium]
MDTKQGITSESGARQVLSSITSAVVGHFEMSKLLDQVVNTSMATLHAEVCSIFLVEREKDYSVLIMRAGSGFAKPLVGIAKYQFGEGFTGYIAAHKKGFNIHTRKQLETLTVDGQNVWQGKHDPKQWPSGKSEFRNCIALPLMIKGECLGVIKVENKQQSYGEYFTEDESSYFEIIANVVALAVENAKLHQQTENQLKAIAGKAAHRIHNQAANYDGIEFSLENEFEKPVPDRAQLQQIVKRLQQTTRSLKRMTEEFKNYGKPLRLNKEISDINKIIIDEVWLAKPPDTIKINYNLSPNIPKVYIDSPRFAEAIKELLRNSIKAISSKVTARGTIEISNKTVPYSLNPNRTISSDDTSTITWIYVTIQDDGPGFPEGFPIFEPFHSTDPSSTGLGLATVKELIEAHGGHIWMTPCEEGTRIGMEIPVSNNDL